MLFAVVFMGCAATLLSPAADIDANSRDSDGSRLQARQIELPSTHADTLSPPDDRIDWRYFKLREAQSIAVRVHFDTTDSGGEMGLAGATGEAIASAEADDGRATLTRRLEAGVYYLRVQATTKTAYELAARH